MAAGGFPSPLIKPDVPISSIRLSDGLHDRLTQTAILTPLQFHDTQLPKDLFGWETPGAAAAGTLVAAPQKVPHAIIHVRIDCPIGLDHATVAEIRFPPPQFRVELVAHFLPRFHLARL
jgi:hypothetical protein